MRQVFKHPTSILSVVSPRLFYVPVLFFLWHLNAEKKGNIMSGRDSVDVSMYMMLIKITLQHERGEDERQG